MGGKIKCGDGKPTPVIKFSGVFDYPGLLKMMRSWLIDHGYEFQEKLIKHKVPTPAGAEQEIEWTSERKVNSYIKFYIDVFFHFWDLHDVEVVREGKKQKLNSAKIVIEITGSYDIDWSKRFSGSKFAKILGDLYFRFVVGKTVGVIYDDQLYYSTYQLHQLIKEHLDMETKSNAF